MIYFATVRKFYFDKFRSKHHWMSSPVHDGELYRDLWCALMISYYYLHAENVYKTRFVF